MAEPEEVFTVVHEWEHNDFVSDELIGLHRSKAGAWLTLEKVAEGQGYDLGHDETSFYMGDQEWYITTETLED